MPRPNKPWFRASRNEYCVTVNGRTHRLGPDKAEANRLFHEIMARPPEAPHAPRPAPESVSLAEVFDKFLDWCQKHRKPRTYAFYRDRVQSFADAQPRACRAPAAELKPYHVHEWADAKPTWGAMQKRGAVGTVQRALAWAEKMGHVEKSPVRGLDKPAPERREQVLDRAEFDRLLAAVKDAAFRDLLVFCWETGARVQEARILEARHYRPERGLFDIPPEEAKGGKRHRLIYLTPAAAAIADRRLAAGGKFVLANARGKAWTAMAVNCRFCRLEKKLGVKYALTALRHSFCQRMVEAGMDTVTLAEVMGHVDAVMLSRVYSHMGQATDHVRRRLLEVAS